MDVNSLDAFCRLMIMTRAQKEADQYVDERCRIKNIPRPLYPQCFSDPELLHSYVLGLVAGALNEYHRQLRANLLEAGIDIDDFIENPLIHSED